MNRKFQKKLNTAINPAMRVKPRPMTPLDAGESFVHVMDKVVEPLVHRLESLVHRLEALVDRLEPFVNRLEALVDRLEPFVNNSKRLSTASNRASMICRWAFSSSSEL
jgi:hypothetical protein